MENNLEHRFCKTKENGKELIFGGDLQISVDLKPINDTEFNEINFRKEVNNILSATSETKDAKVNGSPQSEKAAKRSEHTKRKKKKINEMFGNFGALGYGYDVTDNFIDDTEAFEEIVPDDYKSPIGGFYINCGQLNFTKDETKADLDDSNAGSAPEPMRTKKVKKPADAEIDSSPSSKPKSKKSKIEKPENTESEELISQPENMTTPSSKSAVGSQSTIVPVELPTLPDGQLMDCINNVVCHGQIDMKYFKNDPELKKALIALSGTLKQTGNKIRSTIIGHLSWKLGVRRQTISKRIRSFELDQPKEQLNQRLLELQKAWEKFSESNLDKEETTKYKEFIMLHMKLIERAVEAQKVAHLALKSKEDFFDQPLKNFLSTVVAPLLSPQFDANELYDMIKRTQSHPNNTSWSSPGVIKNVRPSSESVLKQPRVLDNRTSLVFTEKMPNSPVHINPRGARDNLRAVQPNRPTSLISNGASVPLPPNLSPKPIGSLCQVNPPIQQKYFRPPFQRPVWDISENRQYARLGIYANRFGVYNPPFRPPIIEPSTSLYYPIYSEANTQSSMNQRPCINTTFPKGKMTFPDHNYESTDKTCDHSKYT